VVCMVCAFTLPLSKANALDLTVLDHYINHCQVVFCSWVWVSRAGAKRIGPTHIMGLTLSASTSIRRANLPASRIGAS
jgi:hypothetical protein